MEFIFIMKSHRKLVEAAKLLTCLRRLLGSDLGRDNVFFSWGTSVPQIPVGAHKSYFSVVETYDHTNPVNIILVFK
jgi:hypothetical protein